MTGQRPRGFRAPTYRFSRHTLDLLVEEGIDYDASLMGDDIPYLLDNDVFDSAFRKNGVLIIEIRVKSHNFSFHF